MTDIIDNPELIDDKNPPIVIGAGGSGEAMDDIEADFEKFNKANSEFKPEENQTTSDTIDPTEIDLSQAENFKLQIFISLMFTLLDGLHVFIYGFMSKYKITRDDIGLDETDKQGLEIYFKTQRVMDLINRLPVEVIGFLHIEYMYFNKFQEFNKKMKEIEPEEPEEEEEEEEEETPDQKLERIFEEKKKQFEAKKDEVKKDEVKKAAPKKAAPKKAAPKKAAAKKAEVKKVPAKKAAAKKQIEEKK